MSRRIIAQWLLGSLCLCSQAEWARHVIDGTLEGADGVRLADVNRDGWQDIVTGWEESGQVRVYQNPGPKKARQPWPAVTVGKVASPEDAVFADLDQDGQMDVIGSCEGSNRSVYVHWAPAESVDYRNASRWETEPIPALQGQAMWMFTTPGDINGDGRTDLVVGPRKRGYHRLAGGPHLTSQACGLAVASTASYRLDHDNPSDGYGSGWGFGHPFFRSQRKGKRHLRTDQSIERSEYGILEKDSHRSQRGRSHVHGCSLKGGQDLVHLGRDPLAPDPTVHISNREL